jgi:hypothetical protein
MDIPEKLWEAGISAVLLSVVIIAGLKYGLPHLLTQIEREREVSNDRLKMLQKSHEDQLTTITNEWHETRAWLDQKSDSWKQGLEKLDASVCRQTEVIQKEMLRNRSAIPDRMVERAEKKLKEITEQKEPRNV